MYGQTVVKKVCLLSKLVEVIGTVVGETVVQTEFFGTLDCWVVDFTHDGVDFRGWWCKSECF